MNSYIQNHKFHNIIWGLPTNKEKSTIQNIKKKFHNDFSSVVRFQVKAYFGFDGNLVFNAIVATIPWNSDNIHISYYLTNC